jgi:hypothetical protein
MRREITGLGGALTIDISVNFRFKTGSNTFATPTPTFQQLFDTGIACTINGWGPRVVYNSIGPTYGHQKFYIFNAVDDGFGTTDTWSRYNGYKAADGVITTPLAYDTWYTLTISYTLSADGSRTINALVTNAALTEFCRATATISASVSIGDYVGISCKVYAIDLWNDGGGPYTIAPNIVFVDNYTLTTNLVAQSSTTFSGVNTLYIAYHSNNTATWSYDLDSWDNNPVTEGTFTSPLTDSEVSYGFARGQGFICVRTGGATKIYELSITGGTTLVFTDRTTTIAATLPFGFTANDILGVVGSYNYLILYTASTIFWSSTTTPTDFEISLVSGAGNEIPGNLKGDITFCREHLAGFFIYTTKNVVFAVYTGNSKYPWKFREIAGSSGFTYSTQVAGSTNASSQYGLTNSKYIQELIPDQAALIAKEVSDFISTQSKWDIYDTNTNTFSISSSGTILDSTQPRIWYFLDRYVIVPYGFVSGKYTYALLFDTLLKRYGKIKATFNAIATDDVDMYTVDYTTGAISKIYFDIYDQVITGGGQYKHSGVLLLGKFQLVRNNLLQLEEIEIESTQSTTVLAAPTDQQFQVITLPSLNGKTFSTPITPYKDTASSGPWIHYLVPQSVAVNHSILVKDAFDINTLQLIFTVHGQE